MLGSFGGHMLSFAFEASGIGAFAGIPGHVLSNAVGIEGAADFMFGYGVLRSAISNKNAGAVDKTNGPKTTDPKPNWSLKEVNGRRVYQRDDLFDPNAVDANGMTNLERMKKGRPPIGHDGEAVNLHHLTQNEPGSLAEVGGKFHSENSKTLHGLTEPKRSFRYSQDGKTTGAEKAFRRYSYKYWQDRAKGF
jgi:hypothetical protein